MSFLLLAGVIIGVCLRLCWAFGSKILGPRRRSADEPKILADEEYCDLHTLRPPVDYRRLALAGRRRSS